ncbi:MAG: TonB-dependent receptor [Pseudomonadota bacterium]
MLNVGTPNEGAPLLPFGNTGGQLVESQTLDFDDVTPRALLDFAATENFLVYASIARGRRADVIDVGGIIGAADNPTAVVNVLPAEKIWSYDVGIKGQIGGIVYDASVYFQEYENFQTSVIDPNSGDTTPVNAGAATNTGFEGSLSGRVGETFSYFANLAYIDAQFDDRDSNGAPQVFAGNRFRLQPEWSASAGGTYRQKLGNAGSLFATLTGSYRSEVFFEDENAPIAGLEIAEDAITLYNLRIGYEALDARWMLGAFASNLLDEEYIIDAGNTGGVFGTPTFIAGPPRMYGVEAVYRFF